MKTTYFGGGTGGGGGTVTSVFGRVGAVAAALGDYAASLVNNDSSVLGATVKDALNTLSAAILVTSVFGRTGAVVAAAGDYTSSQINNSSAVAGATVTAALNTLNTSIGTLVPTSRTLTGTSPIQIDGSNAAQDLSANRTISVLGVTNAVSGVVPSHPGVLGRALLSAAGAGAPTWGTDFGANDLTTTGNLLVGPTPRSSALGLIRVAHGTTVIAGRNQAAGGDRVIIGWGTITNDGLQLGDTGAGTYRILSSGQQDVYIGAVRQYSLGISQIDYNPGINTTFSLVGSGIVMIQFFASSATRNMSFFGQLSLANWNSSNRVCYIVTATQAPIANPAGGAYFWADASNSNFVWLNPGGSMGMGNSNIPSTLIGAVGSALVGSTANCLRWDTNKLGLYNTAPVVQATRAGQLTDSTTGTPSNTLVDVGITFSQANINNNFASVASKYNALELAIHNIGLTA